MQKCSLCNLQSLTQNDEENVHTSLIPPTPIVNFRIHVMRAKPSFKTYA